jgi:hypothetical protein
MDFEAYVRGMLVGREALDGLAREALRTVRRNLERPRKALPTGLLVLVRRDQAPPERVAVILGEYAEEAKVACYRAAGAKFAGTGLCPVACVLFAEAWMVATDDRRSRPRLTPPRRADSRQEGKQRAGRARPWIPDRRGEEEGLRRQGRHAMFGRGPRHGDQA